MKRVLVLGLVLLLLVIALPLAMAMDDMPPCPACVGPDAVMAMAMCLAILTMGTFITLAFSGRVSLRTARTPRLLPLPSLDRPPQHA